jgi:hypothetical protein
MLAAWDEALTRAHRTKRSAIGGLFSRFARATRPSAAKRYGADRLAYDVGRYGVPIGGTYLLGRHFGLWGHGPKNKAVTDVAMSHLPSGVPIPRGRGSMMPQYMQFADGGTLVRSKDSA